MDQELKNLNIEKIIEIVKAHSDEAWLKALAAEKHINKDGKERRTSFVEIRSAVIHRYQELESLRPKVEKKPTMYELIEKL